MDVTYRRELNEAYMILGEEAECEDYALRILQENRLPGLMSLSIQRLDGSTDYCFSISDGKPLERILERRSLEYREICILIRAIGQILEEMEDYLLNPDHLILDPAFLYLGNLSHPTGSGRCYHEPDFEKLMVCCHPAWRKDFYQQMRSLMQYFINKMDHSDSQGVEDAYQLFHVTQKEYFRVEELLQMLDTLEEGRQLAGEDNSTRNRSDKSGNGGGSRLIDSGRSADRVRDRDKDRGKYEERNKAGKQQDTEDYKKREDEEGIRHSRFSLLSLISYLMQMGGIALLAFSVWLRFRMEILDIRMPGTAILLLIVGLYLQRGKKTKKNRVYHSGRKSRKETDASSKEIRRETPSPVSSKGTRRAVSDPASSKDIRREASDPALSDDIRREAASNIQRQSSPSRYPTGRMTEGGTELLTGAFPGKSSSEPVGRPLLVSENLMEQENIRLTRTPFLLGKDETADGCLPASTISRQHARLDCRGGQYYLEDCHSTNGTFLNGQVLEPEQWYPVYAGDEIALADKKFLFEIPAGLF